MVYNGQSAGVAQLEERYICNVDVGGSIPFAGFMLPSSLTDRAADFGSAGCRFESYLGILY